MCAPGEEAGCVKCLDIHGNYLLDNCATAGPEYPGPAFNIGKTNGNDQGINDAPQHSRLETPAAQ